VCAEETLLQFFYWLALLPVRKARLLYNFGGNQIIIGRNTDLTNTAFRLGHNPLKDILVSGSVIDEVGTTFAGMYEMQTKLLRIKIGKKKNQSLKLISNVGLKGWEAKAIGSFPKRQGLNFNIQYQYSFEDLIINGTGNRITLVKEF
jgi:hypothetical protein